MLEVNGEKIICRLVRQFKKCKIKSQNITFITGFQRHQIKKEFGKKYNFYYYKDFNKTNNLHTLISANNILKEEDCIICFSDIITSINVIEKICKKKENYISTLVDLSKVRNGTMKVKVIKDNLKSIGKIKRKEASGNYIGIMKVPKKKMILFKHYLISSKNKNKNHYFTEVLNDLINDGEVIKTKNVAPHRWIEIDNEKDLQTARNIKNFND